MRRDRMPQLKLVVVTDDDTVRRCERRCSTLAYGSSSAPRVASRFEREEKNREIAAALRVSERSVERWRRSWRERGAAGVASKGSPGRPRLSNAQVA